MGLLSGTTNGYMPDWFIVVIAVFAAGGLRWFSLRSYQAAAADDLRGPLVSELLTIHEESGRNPTLLTIRLRDASRPWKKYEVGQVTLRSNGDSNVVTWLDRARKAPDHRADGWLAIDEADGYIIWESGDHHPSEAIHLVLDSMTTLLPAANRWWWRFSELPS